MLITPSLINRSSTIDNPSEPIYIIPVCVLSICITIIVILNVLRRYRPSGRAVPTNASSRVQNCRVTDITKTLLHTIPIVKFRDPHNSEECPLRADLEMDTLTRDIHESKHARAPAHQKTKSRAQSDENEWGHGVNISQMDQEASNRISPLDLSYVQPNTVCPICTERFRHAQDLRQLPCSHQFHPSCVDPWLLNRSSTCPLCRVIFAMRPSLISVAISSSLNGPAIKVLTFSLHRASALASSLYRLTQGIVLNI